jgi:hypothetical protein
MGSSELASTFHVGKMFGRFQLVLLMKSTSLETQLL